MAWLDSLPEVVAVLTVLTGAVLAVVVLVTALVVVPRNRRPSSATAWIVVLVFVPVLGLLAFFLIGNPSLPAARRSTQRGVDRLITEQTRGHGFGHDPLPGPDWLRPVVLLNQNLGAMPMLFGNSARIETGYDESIGAMAADIAAARAVVHVEFYIVAFDETTAPVFAAMAGAVTRGVTVRVLLDHLGSWRSPGYRRTLAELDRIGVQHHLMLPVQPWRGRYQRPDLRNHRKLVVIDGRIAWIGSQNLVDRSYNKRSSRRRGLQWQDLMVRLRGPVVQEVDALFVADWLSETGELLPLDVPDADEREPEDDGPLSCQVVPSGPGFETEINLRLFNALMYAGRDRISITSPYFVPDESLLYAVTSAAYRGVRVELFVPERGDQAAVHHAQSSYYEQLLRSGVRIYQYPRPYVLHAKHVSVDGEVAVVGSSNLDMRSFSLDLESTLLVHGQEFLQSLAAVEDGYRAVSRELTLERWLARPRWHKLADNLARLTSALQ